MANPENPPAEEERRRSLEDLSSAFAELLGQAAPLAPAPDLDARAPGQEAEAAEHDAEVTPRGILEAMLFVGNPDGSPLSATRAASLMRGVHTEEIEGLVAELNAQYSANRCPYRIESDGAGYRMVLRGEFAELRQSVRGGLRERKLSLPAVETLSIVAYRGPISAEDVNRLRGKPTGSLLAQLVRRGLLRLDREAQSRSTAFYVVTDRFLEVAGLESLEDLPRAQDLEAR